MRVCVFCKKEYTVNPNYSLKQKDRSKFCSRECQAKGRTRKPFTPWNKGKRIVKDKKCDHCSKENKKVTFYKIFKANLCDKHYWHMKLYGKVLWGDERPVKTPLERRQRRVKAMTDWRKKIFERDDYTCQICKERGKQLNADHIKPFRFFPELRLELSNGRTLCVECHRKTPTYGRRLDHIADGGDVDEFFNTLLK